MSETEHNIPKRVLIAEDSAVTQDILSLILAQRNHKVSLADNGQSALDLLQSEVFDVALIDYHLPDIKGLEVVKQFLGDKDNQEVPTLIAMTGDPEALLSSENDCELFEKILTKPIEMEDVIPVIEADDAIRKIFKCNKTTTIEEATEPPTDLPFQSLALDLLYIPLDTSTDAAKRRTTNRLRLRGCPDAVIITNEISDVELEYLFNLAPAHLAPIIDLTATLGNRADISETRSKIPDEAVINIARKFKNLREDLHADFLRPESQEESLIANIYVRGGQLVPQYTAHSKSTLYYNSVLRVREVESIALNITKSRILRSEFFDRMLICENCQSSRLLAREECPECRSTMLYEEHYLHHFRCAFQGAESKFRQGDMLVCPKCRRELTHYGVNYNKPGIQHICQKCTHSSTDPAVGFLCLDCQVRMDGDKIKHVDRFEFEITDYGREYISAGRILLGGSNRGLRFSDLPLEFSVKLNGAAKRYLESNEPFTLISVGYANLAALTREHGEAETTRNRELLLTLLQEAVPSIEATASSKSNEYLLYKGKEQPEAHELFDKHTKKLMPKIKISLEAVAVAYGPDQLA